MSKRRHNGQAVDDVNALERDAWLWQRRRERFTYSQIAELSIAAAARGELAKPVNRSMVARRLVDMRRERLAELGKNIDGERLEVLEELDELSQGFREVASAYYLDDEGETRRRPDSARISGLHGMLSVITQRVKVAGLEAPVVIEATVTHTSEVDEAVRKLSAELEAESRG